MKSNNFSKLTKKKAGETKPAAFLLSFLLRLELFRQRWQPSKDFITLQHHQANVSFCVGENNDDEDDDGDLS